jgi:dTDP-4-dehydrorhamnose reductase
VAWYDPDIVVDTAAFHVVDECETDRRRAWEVNVEGTRNVAVAADSVSAHVVTLSTDYVFSDRSGAPPFAEDDPVSPPNFYGRTKYAGEQAASLVPNATVLRPSVVYGLTPDNFATLVLDTVSNDEEFPAVTDQRATPSYTPDVARASLDLARMGATGLFHAGGPVRLSRYEFATRLVDAFDLDENNVRAVETDELDLRAPRPTDTSLDSTKLYETLGYSFRSPSDAFDAMAERVRGP